MNGMASLDKIERTLSRYVDEENTDASLPSDSNMENVRIDEDEVTVSDPITGIFVQPGIRADLDSLSVGLKLSVYKEFLKCDFAWNKKTLKSISQE